MTTQFDFQEAVQALQAGKNLNGKGGVLTSLSKQLSKAAELTLDELDAKWGGSYPLVINSWRNKWHHLSAYFKYPEHIRLWEQTHPQL